MAGKTIVVLATLDTKGREAEYLRQQIAKFGDTALVIDTGVVGFPACCADVTREEVAAAGGTPPAQLLEVLAEALPREDAPDGRLAALLHDGPAFLLQQLLRQHDLTAGIHRDDRLHRAAAGRGTRLLRPHRAFLRFSFC